MVGNVGRKNSPVHLVLNRNHLAIVSHIPHEMIRGMELNVLSIRAESLHQVRSMEGLASFKEVADSFIDGFRVRDRAHMAETFEFDDLYPWQDLC